MMELYEFITPCDPITFYAQDDDIAWAIGLYVGGGKAGVDRITPEKKLNTMLAFSGGLSREDELKFKAIFKNRLNEIINATQSFAIAKPSERDIYDDYTDNGSDIEKRDKWHDKKRSSLNDFCSYAWSIKIKK
jgi:hypothetical protein